MRNRFRLVSSTPNPYQPQSGFTLVEVMAASIILGMTVSAVAIMIINSSASRATNDHYRQARALVQEQLEGEAYSLYNNPQPTGVTNTSPRMDFGEAPLAPIATARVSTVANDTTLDIALVNIPYQRITSKVTWTENSALDSVKLIKRTVLVK